MSGTTRVVKKSKIDSSEAGLKLPNGNLINIDPDILKKTKCSKDATFEERLLKTCAVIFKAGMVDTVDEIGKINNPGYVFIKEYLEKGGAPNYTFNGESLVTLSLTMSSYQTINLLLDAPGVQLDSTATLHALITRNSSENYNTQQKSFDRLVRERNPGALQSLKQGISIPIVQEVENLWKKLYEKGLNYQALNENQDNALFLALLEESKTLLAVLIQQAQRDGVLVQMFLHLGQSSTLKKLFENICKSESSDCYRTYWADLLKTIKASDLPALSAVITGLKLVAYLQSKYSPLVVDLMRLFEKHEQPFPSKLDYNLIPKIPESFSPSNSRTPEELKAYLLVFLKETATEKTIANVINETLKKFKPDENLQYGELWYRDIQGKSNYLKLLSVLISVAEDLGLQGFVNVIDEDRHWNTLCYFIQALQSGIRWKADCPKVKSLWVTLVKLSSEDSKKHVQDRMNVSGDTWQKKPENLIGEDGWKAAAVAQADGIVQNVQGAAAQAGALVQGAQMETPLQIDAQSTHRAIVHETTSKSEKVLSQRYQSQLASEEHKQKLWHEIDRYYRRAGWLKNEKSYLDDLYKSISGPNLPGDTAGSVKAALTDRYRWMVAKQQSLSLVLKLNSLATSFQMNFSPEKNTNVSYFLSNELLAEDWKINTYTSFKRFIFSNEMRDSSSHCTLQAVFLYIWLGIHDEKYLLTDDEKELLKQKLGLAMIEIMHQYGGMKTSCPSGSHNLLVDAVGRYGLPGIYSFSADQEKTLVKQTLRSKLCIADYFNTLSAGEKGLWFKSEPPYKEATEKCSKFLSFFKEFGESQEFSLFSREDLLRFERLNAITWKEWVDQNSDQRPEDTQVIVSVLNGLSEAERSSCLKDLDAFSMFLRDKLSLDPKVATESLRKEVTLLLSEQSKIKLIDYSDQAFKPGQDLTSWANSHWSDYYMNLTASDLSDLLKQLGKEPKGVLGKDRIVFSALDKERLFESKKLEEKQKNQVSEVYDIWADPSLLDDASSSEEPSSLKDEKDKELDLGHEDFFAIPMEIDAPAHAIRNPDDKGKRKAQLQFVEKEDWEESLEKIEKKERRDLVWMMDFKFAGADDEAGPAEDGAGPAIDTPNEINPENRDRFKKPKFNP